MVVGPRLRRGGRAALRWRSPFAPLAVVPGGAGRRHPRPADLLAAAARRRQTRPCSWRKTPAASARIVPQQNGNWTVHVHGKSHSWIPFGGIHSRLGAAPAMIHPAPLDVAIIGLGSGDTAWASASRPETRSLTVFEISGPQPKLLRQLAEQQPFPDLRAPAERPAPAHPRWPTAATRSSRKARLYDVIEADALWPIAPYAGNLYSVEFFQPVHAAAEAGRHPVHVGAHAARLRVVHPGRAVHRRPARPQRALRQQRADRDRPRRRGARAPSPGVRRLPRARTAPQGTAWLLERVQQLHRLKRRQLPTAT